MIEPATGDYEIDRQRHTKAFFAGMPEEIERIGLARSEQRALRDRRLRALLAHARERSPWHAKRLASLSPNAVSGDDLSSIPAMTKTDLMAHWDEIVCDRRLSLAAANDHLERVAREGPAYLLDEYHVLATGGTSGHRAVVVWDFEGFRLAQSRMVGCGLWLERKWQIDVPLPRRVASVGSANSLHMLGALTRCFSNPDLMTIHAIPASAPIEEVVESLNALQPSALGGYASMLHQLSEHALAGELRVEPTVITTGGEPFLPEAWASVSQAFPRAIVREVWGSTEIGIAASSYPGIDGLVLGEDLVIVEPVDAEGRPVAPGEPAARLLATNLANRILPLIRYEITDEATMLPPHPDCPWAGPRLAAIHGRQDDVFTYPGGRSIHPHTLRSVLTRYAGVAEYQVRQTREGVAVAIHATAAIEVPTLEHELASALAAAGLTGARAEVRCVPGIARHAQSQKLKRFIPLS